jgi:hypothetical protein
MLLHAGRRHACAGDRRTDQRPCPGGRCAVVGSCARLRMGRWVVVGGSLLATRTDQTGPDGRTARAEWQGYGPRQGPAPRPAAGRGSAGPLATNLVATQGGSRGSRSARRRRPVVGMPRAGAHRRRRWRACPAPGPAASTGGGHAPRRGLRHSCTRGPLGGWRGREGRAARPRPRPRPRPLAHATLDPAEIPHPLRARSRPTGRRARGVDPATWVTVPGRRPGRTCGLTDPPRPRASP